MSIYDGKIKSIKYVIGDVVYDYAVGVSFGGGMCEEIEFTETCDGSPYVNIKTSDGDFSIMNVPFEIKRES